jgi:hypothetical protein
MNKYLQFSFAPDLDDPEETDTRLLNHYLVMQASLEDLELMRKPVNRRIQADVRAKRHAQRLQLEQQAAQRRDAVALRKKARHEQKMARRTR